MTPMLTNLWELKNCTVDSVQSVSRACCINLYTQYHVPFQSGNTILYSDEAIPYLYSIRQYHVLLTVQYSDLLHDTDVDKLMGAEKLHCGYCTVSVTKMLYQPDKV